MAGQLAILLHAHLPWVRHPDHARFLEESWLREAITECYVPLLQALEGWRRDGLVAPLTLTLSPTLCAMLRDPLLQERYRAHLDRLIELAEKETYRTHFDAALRPLAELYRQRLGGVRASWDAWGGDLVGAFGRLQAEGRIEIVTCAATHGLLPLLANHPPSLRGQIVTARDHYRECFGCDPRGIWLPECAYVEAVEPLLVEAGLRWFLVDSHGLARARPSPRYGVYAPVFTPHGLAVLGRDAESARQVWSRHEGYPGDFHYRDFYRDIGFDLDADYVRPYWPSPDHRGFTGLKYHRITGVAGAKEPYVREAALATVARHAAHFLAARAAQIERLEAAMDLPPLLVAPYDAELFGHWWYEGPEFLDAVVRRLASLAEASLRLTTPEGYLRAHPTLQVVRPSPSSWGEEGFWRVWLNESNEWVYRHLQVAQERMTALARAGAGDDPWRGRALRQAARELLLAQASDWPFILRTNTTPDYARRRLRDHLLRFIALHEQLTTTRVDTAWLERIEAEDNLFPNLDYRHWA